MKQLVLITVFIGFLFVISLPGCATGVVMTQEDEASCKTEGCTAWTNAELVKLAKKFFNLGYQAGGKSI